MRRPAAGSSCFPAFRRALAHASHRLLACMPAWMMCVGVLGAANVHAGSFTVNPVRIELSADTPSAVLQVESTQGAPVTIQLSTMAWSQLAGKDELKPSREILVTPQIFVLKPGATQIVRIGMQRRPDAEQELSYRLLLEEIPPPPAPDFRGLQVALRISLPVFIKPASAAAPRLVAALRRDTEQQVHLQLTNLGKAAARLQGLSLHPNHDPQRTLATHPSAIYVLPGQTRELSFQLAESRLEELVLIKALMHGVPLELHARSSAQ
jgi:fimbrial chaperone protein